MCSTLFSNNDPTQHKGNSESGSHKGDRLTGTQGEADDPEKEVCMGVHFGTAFKVVHVNALGNAFVSIANFESCSIQKGGRRPARTVVQLFLPSPHPTPRSSNGCWH